MSDALKKKLFRRFERRPRAFIVFYSLFDNVSYYRKLRVVTLPKFSESNADNMKERALGVFFVFFITLQPNRLRYIFLSFFFLSFSFSLSWSDDQNR